MIELVGLARRFGAVEALAPTTLTVPAGQVCALLGPNGAGKSTTLRMLSGLLEPSAGSVRICGHDLREDPLAAKARIGYVPETPALYSVLTVQEHLTLVGDLREVPLDVLEERMERYVELFDLRDALKRRLDSLSKGTRQKVVIAGALLADPEVLLLDEALDGLDTRMARIVRDLVADLAGRGRAVLFSSHVMEIVERTCDRVIIISRGRVVLDGPTSQLVARGASLEELFVEMTAAC